MSGSSPITTPLGGFRVWTRQVGRNPALRLLLLHGGPGATHEYLEPLADRLAAAGVELYLYDQLGSGRSDHPDEPAATEAGLWSIDRFVDEVEQVRTALGLEDFVLYGQSWGGVLALEYALAHQEHLAGLVLSNTTSSSAAFSTYVEEVLLPRMDPEALAMIRRLEARGRTDHPAYFSLLRRHFYPDHVLRLPIDAWPDAVERGFGSMNRAVYLALNGPSELRIGGALEHWDRGPDLGRIDVPTLVMGAEHDGMDPAHLRWTADRLPQGRYHHSPDGSHLALVDDAETYAAGLIDFLLSL